MGWMKRNNEYDVVELTNYLDNVNLDRFYEKILITRRSIVRVYPPQPRLKLRVARDCGLFIFCVKVDFRLFWGQLGDTSYFK